MLWSLIEMRYLTNVESILDPNSGSELDSNYKQTIMNVCVCMYLMCMF